MLIARYFPSILLPIKPRPSYGLVPKLKTRRMGNAFRSISYFSILQSIKFVYTRMKNLLSSTTKYFLWSDIWNVSYISISCCLLFFSPDSLRYTRIFGCRFLLPFQTIKGIAKTGTNGEFFRINVTLMYYDNDFIYINVQCDIFKDSFIVRVIQGSCQPIRSLEWIIFALGDRNG